MVKLVLRILRMFVLVLSVKIGKIPSPDTGTPGVSDGKKVIHRMSGRGSNVFRKDKSAEKLPESEEDLLKHRTDAFDTLYIRAEKFQYNDTFALSVSGITVSLQYLYAN